MDKDRRRGRGDLTDGARLTRRALLRVAAFSAGAAATQATRPPRAAATSPAMHPVPTVPEAAGLRLDAIQGNSLCGFNKDHQRLLFFELTDARRARAWLGAAVASLASASEVLAFNDLYRRAATNQRSAFPSSVWVNVALTFTGLRALGVSTGDLASFPDAFAQGMRARAAVIGDIGASAPGAWVRPLGSPLLHGVLIVAADQHDQLEAEVGAQLTAMSAAGVRLLLDQAGDVRADQPGHEHFGFKDGISQPGIRGLTPPADPHRPDQGAPGQELLWPGEFVLGYPTQISSPGSGTVGENHEPGPISTSGPAWTADGSYLVFRRLRQDVLAFGTFLAQASAETGLHPDLLGAKLVGRYRSGAPLERTEDQLPAVDPQAADPSLADPTLLGAVRVNNFEFGGDPEGLLVPRAAHIRKVYPRDEDTPTGGEAGTQTHRMIRRGGHLCRSGRGRDHAVALRGPRMGVKMRDAPGLSRPGRVQPV